MKSVSFKPVRSCQRSNNQNNSKPSTYACYHLQNTANFNFNSTLMVIIFLNALHFLNYKYICTAGKVKLLHNELVAKWVHCKASAMAPKKFGVLKFAVLHYGYVPKFWGPSRWLAMSLKKFGDRKLVFWLCPQILPMCCQTLHCFVHKRNCELYCTFRAANCSTVFQDFLTNSLL